MKRPRSHILLSLLAGGLLICLAAGCSQGPRRFPLAPPLWEDPDRNGVPKRPGKYYSGMIADVADQTLFRKLSKAFTFPLPGDAKNVNALDEVPNSSWFTNRIGLFPMTPQQVAQGNCNGPPLDPANGPLVVSAAKPDGANPGFFIKASTGTYLLKFDGPVQPSRATAADVIGSRLYHAAGFHAPCNEIVYFRSSDIRIGQGATSSNKFGQQTPLTGRDVDKVLKMGYRLKNGLIRASASKFLPGKPLGPWTYNSTAGDDPNDVIPHEDRRELRGAKLLAAWLAHTDAREQNTLRVWVNDSGRSYVRHYYIDFGDCFGTRWPSDGITRRFGHSYYFDAEHVLVDFLTLGALPRPWFKAQVNQEAEIFGYFDSAGFNPRKWQAAYPNPAFDRMNFRDALWMVRILSRFTDDHVRAAIKTGKLLFRHQEDYLTRIMIERRDKILREYLTRYAPLAGFRLVRRTPGRPEQSLCSEDLAIKHRLVRPGGVLYKLRFMGGEKLDRELGWLQFSPDPDHPHRSCVVLPIGDRRPADLAPASAPKDHPLRYGVLKIYIHQKPALPPTSSIWLHFYDLGPEEGFRLVGVDRRPEPVTPDLY